MDVWIAPILTGVVSGVVTAAAWAGAVWLFMLLRDRRMRRDIIACIDRVQVWDGAHGVGFTLANETHIPWIVRQVVMVCSAKDGHPDAPPGSRALNYHLNYLGPAEFGSRRSAFADSPPASDGERNFVRLDAFTSAHWGFNPIDLHDSMLADQVEVTGCEFTIEHSTLFKRPRVLNVPLSGGTRQRVAEWFEMSRSPESLARRREIHKTFRKAASVKARESVEFG